MRAELPAGVAIRPAQAADWPAIRGLLESHALPVAGAESFLDHFLLAERGGRVIACVGLEHYGTSALLRSCAVDDALRGQGIGAALVTQLIERAFRAGVRRIGLLTTSADRYFPKLGFRVVPRAEIAAEFADSLEFRGACPASAVAMLRTAPD